MVAIAYHSLGGINGVTEGPSVPASMRSADRNRYQRMVFSANPTRPFTGILHVQTSVSDPTLPKDSIIWVDIAEMHVNNEGGNWSYEFVGEFSLVRVVCRAGNYWASIYGVDGTTSAVGGAFTVNGVTVPVAPGDGAVLVSQTINTMPELQTTGVHADVFGTSTLRIYNRTGVNLVLEDTLNTPLVDMGITPGTYRGGQIVSINVMR